MRWPADEPGRAGRRGSDRWDARPDLRVSDAERDTVVTELGEHFREGRLDQTEFDERMTQALAARTRRELGELLADLPPVPEAPGTPQPPARRPRLPVLAPLLLAVIVIAAFTVGGWHHPGNGEWVPWPLLWLLAIVVLRFGWWRRGWRRQRR
jgi:hypothetical protein